MPDRIWTKFAPAIATSADWHNLLRYASELANDSQAEPETHRAGLAVLDTVRREVVGGRSRPSLVVQAAGLVLADLVAHGWLCRVTGETVEISAPTTLSDLALERDRVRRQLHVERNRQLEASAVRAFIASMERRRFHRGAWISIYSLMRDGAELAAALRRRREGHSSQVGAAIRPYLQTIQNDEVCEHSGLRLADVWRYFRHTWALPYRSVPGRSVMLLVRDAAVEPHPVIGIAALASSAVQISVRDEWIGWSSDTFVNDLRQRATDDHVQWLLRLIDDGVGEIHQDDLLDPATSPLTRRLLHAPTADLIAWLETYAREQRDKHQQLVDAGDHKRATSPINEWDERRWRSEAEKPLFRSKRAETLAMLLRARITLSSAGRRLNGVTLRELLASAEARQAVQSLVRRAKAERVGVAMADISICGAIAPYSALLGGKLVAMLLLSPQVVTAYRERYSTAESVIASSLAGRPVVRPPHLVFLGTTSLYGTEPTQYTRVHVPCSVLGGQQSETLRYRLLGRTEGYGTLQFSADTVDALATLLAQSGGGQRVHSIFGEGVNPRLRKVRDGLDQLGLPSDALLTHGSPRLVYGVALARNFRQYLLGIDPVPEYFVPIQDPKTATERIAAWWTERWLSRRIQRDDILREVATHRTTYPIQHGARVRLPADPSGQLSLFSDIAHPGAVSVQEE